MTVNISCFCEAQSAKYKCPICKTPYCSVNCFRIHKSTPCTPPPAPQVPLVKEVVKPCYTTEDTLSSDKLENLRNSPCLREHLNNPHLRHIMNSIDKSKNPTDLIAQAMLEPIFVEFATECLNVVQPKDNIALASDNEDYC